MDTITEDIGYLGYAGYKVTTDGEVISPKGNYLYGNAHGQVALMCSDGLKAKWVKISWLVATVFVENPLDLPNVIFLDRDRTNCKFKNLEWGIGRHRNAPKKDRIKELLLEGYNDREVAIRVEATTTYVQNIRKALLREVIQEQKILTKDQ